MEMSTAQDEVLALTATSNPYLDFYWQFCREHPGELTAVFDPELSDERRSEMYAALDVSVAMRYSWAIPDERALQIMKHYGPIVEMGAGSGYWARLLQLRGVDVVAYDLHVANEDGEAEQDGHEAGDVEDADKEDRDAGKTAATSGEESHGDAEEVEDDSEGEDADEEADEDDEGGEGEEYEQEVGEEGEEEEVEVEQVFWMDVQKGTPKDLRKHADRALFLCYPDDFEDSDESMALASLCNYAGDTVIHVGELFGQTVCLPGAWGRTSSEDFQKHLATVYHKVLQVPLPSWHSSMDTLTVWKRTKSSITDGGMYAYIPAEERLDLVEACPATRHLLHLADAHDDGDTDASKSKKRRKTGSGD